MIFSLHFQTNWLPRYIECNFAQKVGALPTRFLPPGTVKMIWMEFRLSNPGISLLEGNPFNVE